MDKIVGALAKGDIDAFINPEPLCTVAIEKGIAEQMLTTQSLWNNHPCCVLTALKKTLDENENLVKDVSRATIASAAALDNPEDRPALIQQIRDQNEIYQKLPLELLQKAFAPGRSDFRPLSLSEFHKNRGETDEKVVADARRTPISINCRQTYFFRTLRGPGCKNSPSPIFPRPMKDRRSFTKIFLHKSGYVSLWIDRPTKNWNGK